MRLVALVAAAGALVAMCGAAGGAAGGALDPSFGGDGTVTVDFGAGDLATGIAVQSDGKLVAAGGTQDMSGRVRIAVMRLNPDGGLDPSFDGDGRVVTDFGSDWALANAVAIQRDGKIVVAGNVFAQGYLSFALARYNADGSLDPTFGSGGKVVTSFGLEASALTVLVQPDDKIIAVGIAYAKQRPCCAPSDFALVRYNPDGRLDATFDGDGKLFTDFGGSETATAAAVQPDGKIVVAGETSEAPVVVKNLRIALARYLPNGTLDADFGGGGRVVTDLPNGDEGASGLAIEQNGGIVVAAGRAIVRYTNEGSLDPRFGDNGLAVPGGGAFPWLLALQANGKIVTLGQGRSGLDFDLARLLPDGSPDTHFGTGGSAVAHVGADDYPRAVAIQPDGKIVAAGAATSGALGEGDAAFVRYLPGTCSVPSVTGVTLAAARRLLATANCRLGRTRRTFSTRVKKGRIVKQTPRPGHEAADWALVNLVVSRGRRH